MQWPPRRPTLIRHHAPWVGLACATLIAAALLLDVRIGSLVRNTAWLVAGTLAISMPLGTAAAVLIARTDMPGRRLAAAGLAAMLLVPVYLQAAAWQAGFGLQGWITLNWIGDVWLTGLAAAVWVHGIAAVPWVALIVGAGLRLVEPELEEQALVDAAPARVFRHVTLPACWGALGVAALWVTVTTSTEIAVTDLFAVRTFAEEIYTQTALGPTAVQGGFLGPPGFLPCLLLCVALVLAGMTLLLAVATARRPPSRRPLFDYPLGRYRPAAASSMALLLVAVIGVPLVNLAAKAGIVVTQTATGRVRQWTPQKFIEIVVGAPRDYADEFQWTLLIGLLAASAATLAGTLLAWWASQGRTGRLLVWSLAAVALATPGPIIGLGVIWLVNKPEIPLATYLYDNSILAPWLAQSIRALPPAVLIMWFAFHSISPKVLDAARVDGAGGWPRLLRIALPLRLRPLLLAWLASAIVATGELSATILTVPPGVLPLQVRIFSLLHYGVEDRVAGICLASAAVFAGATWGFMWACARTGTANK